MTVPEATKLLREFDEDFFIDHPAYHPDDDRHEAWVAFCEQKGLDERWEFEADLYNLLQAMKACATATDGTED